MRLGFSSIFLTFLPPLLFAAPTPPKTPVPPKSIPYSTKEFGKLDFNFMQAPDGVKTLKQIQTQLQKVKNQPLKAIVGIEFPDGFGSGVIVSKDGLIMTAAHVTGGVGKEFTCILPGGKRTKAIALGLNSETDCALAQILEPGPFEFIEIAKKPVEVGEWVFSLGHSGGYDKERGPGLRLGRVVRINSDGIISDCRLIGGDSGGPQFNMNGQLIGIHSRVGLVMEENVSVPIELFAINWEKMTKNQFIGDGEFAKKIPAFLGAATEATETGLKITRLAENGSAKKGGLLVGDILTKIGDQALKTKEELTTAMQELSAGQKTTFSLIRDGKPLTIEITLGSKE